MNSRREHPEPAHLYDVEDLTNKAMNSANQLDDQSSPEIMLGGKTNSLHLVLGGATVVSLLIPSIFVKLGLKLGLLFTLLLAAIALVCDALYTRLAAQQQNDGPPEPPEQQGYRDQIQDQMAAAGESPQGSTVTTTIGGQGSGKHARARGIGDTPVGVDGGMRIQAPKQEVRAPHPAGQAAAPVSRVKNEPLRVTAQQANLAQDDVDDGNGSEGIDKGTVGPAKQGKKAAAPETEPAIPMESSPRQTPKSPKTPKLPEPRPATPRTALAAPAPNKQQESPATAQDSPAASHEAQAAKSIPSSPVVLPIPLPLTNKTTPASPVSRTLETIAEGSGTVPQASSNIDRIFATVPVTSRRPTFRVVTYNILADGPNYSLSLRHNYCHIRARAWDQRYPRLWKELESFDADILCLQETTPMTFKNYLAPDLQAAGYRAVHAIRRREAGHHSTAMFVRSSVFSLVHLATVRYAELALELMKHEANPHMCSVYKDLATLDDVAIICHLRHRETDAAVVAVTTHLHYHPVNPHLKVMQAWLLLQSVHNHISKWELSEEATVVIAGDFNSLPCKTTPDEFDPVLPEGGLVSGVYELITKGSLDVDHPDHPAARQGIASLGGELHSELQLSSAMKVALGEEPLITTKTSDFSGTLDYVFVRGESNVVRVLRMPFQSPAQVESFPPIPDAEKWPSDHLPILCDIAVTPSTSKPAAAVSSPVGQSSSMPASRWDLSSVRPAGGTTSFAVSPRGSGLVSPRGGGSVVRSRHNKKRSSQPTRNRLNTM